MNIDKQIAARTLIDFQMSCVCFAFLYIFSNSTAEKHLYLSKNTIKKHRKIFYDMAKLRDQGKPIDIEHFCIERRHFESYFTAFENINKENIRFSKRIQAKNISQDGYRKIFKFFQDYKDLFLIEDNFFKVDFNLPLDYLSSNNRCSDLFVWRLNICFKAFCTLTVDDVFFAIYYHKGNTAKRKQLMEQIHNCPKNIEERNELDDTINLWINALKHFKSSCKGNKSRKAIVKAIQKKADKYVSSKNLTGKEIIEKGKNIIALCYFFKLILPGEGRYDTDFGIEEMKALIYFKFQLTKNAKKYLVDQLLNEHTN